MARARLRLVKEMTAFLMHHEMAGHRIPHFSRSGEASLLAIRSLNATGGDRADLRHEIAFATCAGMAALHDVLSARKPIGWASCR